MLAKFGEVLYLFGCSMAVVFAIGALMVLPIAASETSWANQLSKIATYQAFLPSIASWVMGRGCLYFMAGR